MMQISLFKAPKKYLFFAVLLPFSYCAFVLCYVWWQCYISALQGGRNGQLDAYRHTLASAVVAYSSSPKVVGLVTTVMESKNKPPNLMDQHNNAIGAIIGKNAATFYEIKPAVMMLIMQGAVNTKKTTQITWLPRQYWRESLLW